MNGSVIEASQEVLVLYNLVGNAALTVVLNVAARINKAKNIISRKEMVIFLLLLFLSFVINECFFIARVSELDKNALLIGSSSSFLAMILTMVLYERMTETTKKQKQTELTNTPAA